MALVINDSNFKELVLDASQPALIDFWAEWCGPCRVIAPIIDQLSTEYADKIIIAKVNVDESNEIPTQYGIRNIPTLLFFKNGQVVDKIVGAASKATIEEKIKAIL